MEVFFIFIFVLHNINNKLCNINNFFQSFEHIECLKKYILSFFIHTALSVALNSFSSIVFNL